MVRSLVHTEHISTPSVLSKHKKHLVPSVSQPAGRRNGEGEKDEKAVRSKLHADGSATQ